MTYFITTFVPAKTIHQWKRTTLMAARDKKYEATRVSFWLKSASQLRLMHHTRNEDSLNAATKTKIQITEQRDYAALRAKTQERRIIEDTCPCKSPKASPMMMKQAEGGNTV